MKKFMKQWMTLALAVMMLVTAVPMGNVEAKAKKLGKKDFEYTFEGKKHDFVTEKKQYEWSWFVFYDIPESKYCKNPGKTMKTKRNVKLGSTESKVTKQYGKATKKKVSKTERYYKLIKYDHPALDTSTWKNYLEYTYKKGKDKRLTSDVIAAEGDNVIFYDTKAITPSLKLRKFDVAEKDYAADNGYLDIHIGKYGFAVIKNK